MIIPFQITFGLDSCGFEFSSEERSMPYFWEIVDNVSLSVTTHGAAEADAIPAPNTEVRAKTLTKAAFFMRFKKDPLLLPACEVS